MFQEMRRKDRELQNTEAIEILKKCNYGTLSTVNKDGYPYGVPVSYVYFNDAIYFHCAVEGSKLNNIAGNNKVSFSVVGETCILPSEFSTKYESVIIFGKATEVFDSEKNDVFMEIIDKYSPDFMTEGKKYVENAGGKTKVIKISIEHISGKARR